MLVWLEPNSFGLQCCEENFEGHLADPIPYSFGSVSLVEIGDFEEVPDLN